VGDIDKGIAARRWIGIVVEDRRLSVKVNDEVGATLGEAVEESHSGLMRGIDEGTTGLHRVLQQRG
jgi:hypothetical protein